MKVYLLNPPTYTSEQFIREGRCQQRLASFQYVMTPITLPSIAALLREKGHQVVLQDAMATQKSVPQVLEEIKKEAPDLLVAVSSTVTMENDQKVLAEIKKDCPSTFLTLSGTHATSLPENILESCPVDAIIRNEPEMTTLELANTLEKGESLEQVLGVTFRFKENLENPNQIPFQKNPDRPFIKDLDELPFPARDLLPLDRYRLPTLNEPYTLLPLGNGFSMKIYLLNPTVNTPDPSSICFLKGGTDLLYGNILFTPI